MTPQPPFRGDYPMTQDQWAEFRRSANHKVCKICGEDISVNPYNYKWEHFFAPPEEGWGHEATPNEPVT